MTLDVTLEQVNLILSGLGELPAKHVFSLIEAIRTQTKAQLPPIKDPAQPLESTLDDYGSTN